MNRSDCLSKRDSCHRGHDRLQRGDYIDETRHVYKSGRGERYKRNRYLNVSDVN